MTTYKLEYHPVYNDELKLTEVGQSRAVRFALGEFDDAKKQVLQLHLSVKCRDYFAEILYGSAMKKKYNMYGFSWDGAEHQVVPEKTGILVFINSSEQRHNFAANFQQLVEWEKTTNFGMISECHQVDGNPSCVFIKCDPKWFSNTFTISFYTLLLRCLCYPNIKEISIEKLYKSLPHGNDKNIFYYMVEQPHFDRVFKDPNFLILDNKDNGLGWGTGATTSLIHDYGGIQSFVLSLKKYEGPFEYDYYRKTRANKNIEAFLKAVA